MKDLRIQYEQAKKKAIELMEKSVESLKLIK